MGFFDSIIGTVAGGLLGGIGSKSSSGGSQTQTVKNEPWVEAQPWIKDNIQTGQDLQKYYQQNPFNLQQQQAYSNLFSDLNMFRNQIAPELFNRANQMTNNAYQRPTYERPGMAGYSKAGLLDQPQKDNAFHMPTRGDYAMPSFTQPQDLLQQPVAAVQPQPAGQMTQEEIDARIKAALAGQYDKFSPFYNGGAGS